MKRRDFLSVCATLGIGVPLQATLLSCTKEKLAEPKFSGKVIVIGAGPAGLAAGYLLHQAGVEVEILEAAANVGGRLKINKDFTSFPISLGAEWIETSTAVFSKIVNDPSVELNFETTQLPDDDTTFVRYSWYEFFQDYVVPSISDKIVFNTPVDAIDYTDERIVVSAQTQHFLADRVIVAVPLKILQDSMIRFTPLLPSVNAQAIADVEVWGGFKAFLAFSSKFYEREHDYGISPASDGCKIYYDAAIGHDPSKNIVGLFTVGKPSLAYTTLSDSDQLQLMLSELDELYDNKASLNFQKHITQNWNAEPFIRGGYVSNFANWRAVRNLRTPLGNKVYFAGTAFTDGENWGSVHNATDSAKLAVDEILS